MCLNWVAVAADDLVNSPLMPGIKYDRFAQCKAEFSEVHMPCHGLEYHPTNGSLASYQSSFKRLVEAAKGPDKVNECLSHWCYNPSRGPGSRTCEYSIENPVLAGTWCDINKWCIEGQCIPTGTLKRGPNTPGCSRVSRIFGRYAALIVGVVFFTFGLIASVCRKRERVIQRFSRLSGGNRRTPSQYPKSSEYRPQYQYGRTDKTRDEYSARAHKQRTG
ncbi:hypothetical protein EB796_015332 [Bugula neritina]|uniref:ADAMTS cysteine-rich domain-containing protein n=1 Tax=Bugula neritina TaxID=10212 RepID=A0A7J7JLU9_BUGNE|nr:hypothetical protein EB796_015332 [Bugula neritina]